MKSILFVALLGATVQAWADSPDQIDLALRPTVGNAVTGQLKLTEIAGGVTVAGRIEGLTPGPHGFHLHDKADCSGDASGAGGHYNPAQKTHGEPGPQHHAGDLGNITADDKGVAVVDAKLSGVRLASLHSRALVVHAKADDLISQPAGDSGPRIACGAVPPLAQ